MRALCSVIYDERDSNIPVYIIIYEEQGPFAPSVLVSEHRSHLLPGSQPAIHQTQVTDPPQVGKGSKPICVVAVRGLDIASATEGNIVTSRC